MYAIVGLVWFGFASAILYSKAHADFSESNVAVTASELDLAAVAAPIATQ